MRSFWTPFVEIPQIDFVFFFKMPSHKISRDNNSTLITFNIQMTNVTKY